MEVNCMEVKRRTKEDDNRIVFVPVGFEYGEKSWSLHAVTERGRTTFIHIFEDYESVFQAEAYTLLEEPKRVEITTLGDVMNNAGNLGIVFHKCDGKIEVIPPMVAVYPKEGTDTLKKKLHYIEALIEELEKHMESEDAEKGDNPLRKHMDYIGMLVSELSGEVERGFALRSSKSTNK